MLNWYYMNRQHFIYKVKTPRNIMTTQNVHVLLQDQQNYKYFKSKFDYDNNLFVLKSTLGVSLFIYLYSLG